MARTKFGFLSAGAILFGSAFVFFDSAIADEGGLGTSPPPPMLGGVRVVPPPMPYSATCFAPPVTCVVSSGSNIPSNSPCWCRISGGEYATGKTE